MSFRDRLKCWWLRLRVRDPDWLVIPNEIGARVKQEGPNKGEVLPYLSKAVDGRSVAIRVEPDDVKALSVLSRWGRPTPLPSGLATVPFR